MKQKIIIGLIVGAVATLGTFFGMRSCEQAPAPRIVEKWRTETLQVKIPGDTVYIYQPTVVYRDREVFASDSMQQAYEAEIEQLRRRYDEAVMALAEYQVMTMIADTTIERSVMLHVGEWEGTVVVPDRIGVEADLPPYEAIRVKTDALRIAAEIPVEHTETECGTPWWVQALIAVGGIVAGYFSGQ